MIWISLKKLIAGLIELMIFHSNIYIMEVGGIEPQKHDTGQPLTTSRDKFVTASSITYFSEPIIVPGNNFAD